jgi:hypothetical protein
MMIECIAAAAEVKTTLTKNGLTDSIEKGCRFKSLTAIPGESHMLVAPERGGIRNSDLDRYYERRPFFLFAYENMVAAGTIETMLAEACSTDEPPPVDAVFLLGAGVGINFWDGNGTLHGTKPDGTPMTGWDWSWEPSGVLARLLAWLLWAMPRFGLRSSPFPHTCSRPNGRLARSFGL